MDLSPLLPSTLDEYTAADNVEERLKSDDLLLRRNITGKKEM